MMEIKVKDVVWKVNLNNEWYEIIVCIHLIEREKFPFNFCARCVDDIQTNNGYYGWNA